MKFCQALNGALNIERDRVHFCVAVKQNMPTIPWNPDEDLPLGHIRSVRDALIREFNGDMDKPVKEYVFFGIKGAHTGHPCKGCRHIIDVDANFKIPPTDQLTCYLHMQAFTYCNAKCVYCNLRLDEGRTALSHGHQLDHSIYKAVRQMLDAGAIASTCRIIFSSGEPSLSRKGMETLSYLTKHNFNVLINTNAICFAPEIEDALRTGRTHVQVSLESGTRQNYLDIKGVDRFNRVAENIDRYLTAVKGDSAFWVKYIVFSKTNSCENMDRFVDFCRDHCIRNVVVNANYNEGEDVSPNCLGKTIVGEEGVTEDFDDFKTLQAFGYLTAKLEMLGINVHKEFAHLTMNEAALAKKEYALAIMNCFGFSVDEKDSYLLKIVEGMEYAVLSANDPRLRTYLSEILKRVEEDSSGIALFGAGAHSVWISSIMDEHGTYPIVAFDNNPPAYSKFSFPVVKPSEISNYDVDTVIVASNAYHLQIYGQLLKMPEFAKINIIDPYLDLPLR